MYFYEFLVGCTPIGANASLSLGEDLGRLSVKVPEVATDKSFGGAPPVHQRHGDS